MKMEIGSIYRLKNCRHDTGIIIHESLTGELLYFPVAEGQSQGIALDNGRTILTDNIGVINRDSLSDRREQIPDEKTEKESDDVEEEVIIEDKSEALETELEPEDIEESVHENEREKAVLENIEVEEEEEQEESGLPDEEPQQEDVEEKPDEDEYKLFPDEDVPEELSGKRKPDFKTEDLEKMVDPADREKEDIDRFLDDLKKEREEQKKVSSETDTLPPWAKNIQNESLDQIQEEDETVEDAEDQEAINRLMTESIATEEEPLTKSHEADTGMGLPEKIDQKDLPFYSDSMEMKKGKDWKLPLNILQWIRSRALVLLFVALLWLSV